MSLNLNEFALDTASPAFFRFRELPNGKVIVTNIEGNFLALDKTDFRLFAEGKSAENPALHKSLVDGNFLREGYDEKRAADGIRARKRFLSWGPNLHILVVTLRCNETCVYCHASRANMDVPNVDMSKETAEQAVDMILRSTCPSVTIEFQGGEPLVNFPVVQHVIEYATEKNKTIGKQIEFTMVSNLGMMDEEKLAYLLEHKVQICTSIDGPKHLHDKQRKLPGFSAFDTARGWIKRINEAYGELGLDQSLYHVEALLTTTRDTLPLHKEVVDTYAELGCRALFLRPIDPFGFAAKTAHRTEYPRAEYLDFYRRSVDYMIELNKQGTQILERYAAIFLTKILSGEDPNFLDIRSPGGAAIGALAYNFDGRIYTCDEGRMLAAGGDETFYLGKLGEIGYRDVIGHETVRAVVLASNLDTRPDCVNCAYQPYCGIPAAHCHKTQGSLGGRMRDNLLCAVHKGIQDYLFEKISENDPATMEVFRRWTTIRPREHFLQDPVVL